MKNIKAYESVFSNNKYVKKIANAILKLFNTPEVYIMFENPNACKLVYDDELLSDVILDVLVLCYIENTYTGIRIEINQKASKNIKIKFRYY